MQIVRMRDLPAGVTLLVVRLHHSMPFSALLHDLAYLSDFIGHGRYACQVRTTDDPSWYAVCGCDMD